VEAAIRWTMEALEKGAAERVAADWKVIRAGRSDEEFGNIFYSEIQARRDRDRDREGRRWYLSIQMKIRQRIKTCLPPYDYVFELLHLSLSL
jgi:hypothetical protein